MALVQPPGAVRVRHQRLEAEQETHAEDREGEKQDAADADRANRFRAQRSDDDRVHQSHRHPPDLGENDGARELQHRPQLIAKRHSPHYDRHKAHGTRLRAVLDADGTLASEVECVAVCTLRGVDS